MPQSSGTKAVSDKSIISIMNSHWKKNNPEYWKKGNRGNSIFRLACWMCKWGVDEGLAIEYFIDGWEDDTRKSEAMWEMPIRPKKRVSEH